MNNEKFENVKLGLENNSSSLLNQVEKTKDSLILAHNKKELTHEKIYIKRINYLIDAISNINNKLKCMRPNNEEDFNERLNIFKNFNELVKNNIPDDIPLVFHGNNNIETVKNIISSGGLFTPNERYVESTSFATQIDVASKNDISACLGFADAGINSFLPYGAIFVFYPKEYEYEKVLNTKGTEVLNGVESINFIEEDRLFAIITTKENIESLKKVCLENAIEEDKVLTHDEFITLCKNKFKKENKLR